MSFYTALTGLNGSQADISATSNNIANVATTGYKRSKAEFGDIFATSPLQNASSSMEGDFHLIRLGPTQMICDVAPDLTDSRYFIEYGKSVPATRITLRQTVRLPWESAVVFGPAH